MRNFLFAWMATAMAALLAGCAAYGPGDIRTGDDEAAVVKSMGEPAARYPMPGGVVRMAYARGPAGQHTFMLDLGPDGRVISVRQVLGERQFAALTPGITEEELLREIGPPAERRPVGIKPGTIWSYRYPTNECLWYQITIGPDHRLQDGSYGADPRCGERRHPDR
jgi:hypothetical protein